MLVRQWHHVIQRMISNTRWINPRNHATSPVFVFSHLKVANQTQLGKATYVHCGERFKDEGERFFCLLPNQCRLSSSKLQHAFMLMRREKSKDVYVLR